MSGRLETDSIRMASSDADTFRQENAPAADATTAPTRANDLML
jgi:hypothetical protein